MEDVVRDFGGEVADENVAVVREIFFGGLILVSPVAANLGVEDLAPVEGLESGFGGSKFVIFDESSITDSVMV